MSRNPPTQTVIGIGTEPQNHLSMILA